jgi:hypothetical protein
MVWRKRRDDGITRGRLMVVALLAVVLVGVPVAQADSVERL